MKNINYDDNKKLIDAKSNFRVGADDQFLLLFASFANARAFPAFIPTKREPTKPGPTVAANAVISFGVKFVGISNVILIGIFIDIFLLYLSLF